MTNSWGRNGLTRSVDGNVEIDLVGAYITFSAEVQNEIETIIRQLGREMRAELEEMSPDGRQYLKRYKRKTYLCNNRKSSGAYKRGWKVRFSDSKKGTGGKLTATAYQKGEDYRLVHLLEFGHRMPNGGTFYGNPIVSQIQEKYRKKAVEEIKRLLYK